MQSVLNQTHSDFELIIVDDGSTDGSAAVVESVADPRVRLIRQPNGGVSRARNAGVRIAQAEWVAFLDADDEYLPRFLEQVADFLNGYPDAGLSMVGANYIFVDCSKQAVRADLKSGIYDFFDLFRHHISPCCSSSAVVQKDKFLRVGGFPEGVTQFEDWILWVKLACAGKFGYISVPLGLYHHIRFSASRSEKQPDDFFDSAIRVIRTMRECLMKKGALLWRKTPVLKCSNEFAVDAAGMLARDGAKRLALKMLRFYKPKYSSIHRRGRIIYLLLHLIVPQWVKSIYWHRKNL
jgi:glycosyltransferase involved in cell wall biosynthesis